MTDKERYEAAMEENHKLREDLKNWKEAHDVLFKENLELKNKLSKKP